MSQQEVIEIDVLGGKKGGKEGRERREREGRRWKVAVILKAILLYLNL